MNGCTYPVCIVGRLVVTIALFFLSTPIRMIIFRERDG